MPALFFSIPYDSTGNSNFVQIYGVADIDRSYGYKLNAVKPSGPSLCYHVVDQAGKDVANSFVKVDYDQYFWDISSTGKDGRNCITGSVGLGDQYSITGTSRTYTNTVTGTLTGNIEITLVTSATPPTATPTRTSAPGTPTATRTSVPTTTSAATKSPVATATMQKTNTPNPTNTTVATSTATATKTVMATATATKTATATPTQIVAQGVTVNVALYLNETTPAVGFRVGLLVDGVERGSKSTNSLGAVQFFGVPLGMIDLQLQTTTEGEWHTSSNVPFLAGVNGAQYRIDYYLKSVVPTATPTRTSTPRPTSTPNSTATPTPTRTTVATPTNTPLSGEIVTGKIMRVSGTSSIPYAALEVVLQSDESTLLYTGGQPIRISTVTNSAGDYQFTVPNIAGVRLFNVIPGVSVTADSKLRNSAFDYPAITVNVAAPGSTFAVTTITQFTP